MKTLYQAEDGRLFEDPRECLYHEAHMGFPVSVTGNITKIIKKRVVDGTGIHYLIKTIWVAENDGHEVTRFYNIPVSQLCAYQMKGRVGKGSAVVVTGYLITQFLKGNPEFVINSAQFELCSRKKHKK